MFKIVQFELKGKIAPFHPDNYRESILHFPLKKSIPLPRFRFDCKFTKDNREFGENPKLYLQL